MTPIKIFVRSVQRYRLIPKGVYLLSKYDEVRDEK